ncbi:hypothetical protein AAG570_002583 [Ranatra chinensis]|uniref:JmjC domain-containing protein n=1 Tax=Ranatra chinensis TaxID=642074 RepID=A0ABD0Y804_9HEMI
MHFKTSPVETYDFVSWEDLTRRTSESRQPLVIANVPLGPCLAKWEPHYLARAVGDRPVKVHVSSTPAMDFLAKNFLYKTMPFCEFVRRIGEDRHKEYFVSETELYYLRSVGSDRREVADLQVQFPEIAADFKVPGFIPTEDYFSSVLRVGSDGLRVWTHYDVMDNVLAQVHGRKKVYLFSPSDAPNLYLSGDKSRVVDLEEPDFERFPLLERTLRFECTLRPGDVLYIPALWFHNTICIGPSIGVNVFWKNLPHSMYDNSDVYGNKDLVPASKVYGSEISTFKINGV